VRKIEELQTNMQRIKTELCESIKVANAYKHPNIIAEFIAGQLNNRVS